MKYVDAEWVYDEITGGYTIRATGDDGSISFVGALDSDVPPWPEYLAGGGEVRGTPPSEAKES